MSMQRVIARIVRFVAGNPRSTPRITPKVDGADTKVDLSDYSYVGEFTPHATEGLIERFKKEGIRFTFDCDTTAPADTASEGGCYAERRTVSIYVHREDLTRSRLLLEVQ